MTAGRPCTFTQEMADHICSEMASGRSLRSICDDEGMPERRTVFRWLSKNDEFRHQYARAQEDRAAALAEDILEIADEGSEGDTQRAKLRVDTRKWLMSKMAPKKYGDRTELDHVSSDGSVAPTKIVVQGVAAKKDEE